MNTLTNEQKINLTVSPLTAGGKPATLTGIPLWSSSDINSITLVVSPDGLSVEAFAANIGSSTISVIGNAGTDVSPIQLSASVLLQVVSAPAASLNIVVGSPIGQ